MQFLQYVKSLFSGSLSGISNLVVYVAIVVLFAMGLVRCVLPVMHTRGVLRRAIRSIRSSGDKKYAWQEDAFLGKGALFAHWSEYLNNLFFADGRYHNASNVEDYINEETVIYGPGRISFAEALPGLLTSLGFLGTLIGLAKGLSGFSMADADSVQSSIVTLIPGMRYAFMTSIFGVIGSVLFTLVTRAVYGSTQHTLTQFYSAMSRHAGVLSVDPMTQIAIYQQEQTALIKTMTKDLNGKFTETITGAISKSVEPLNETMKGFVNGISREQARLIDNVLAHFIERMNDSLRGELKRFGDVLAETSRLQQDSCAAVRSSMNGLNTVFDDLRDMEDVIQRMLSGMSDYTRRLNDARQQGEEAFMRIESAVEKMELVSHQESSYLKTVSAVQAELSQANKDMNASLARFAERLTEESSGASDAMRAAATDLRIAGEKLAQVHQDAANAVSAELNTTLDAYRDYVNQFTQRVDYLSASITGALEQMPEAVTDANNRFLDQMDAVTDALEQAQRGLNETVDRLYGSR
ncbi:MAG: MotA/TolQ/ExbB proton channel family protein [Clostridia bacterium]|nr:MotA/TolQ/ExbB proton channel family protein [Clostridia bacterium]